MSYTFPRTKRESIEDEIKRLQTSQTVREEFEKKMKQLDLRSLYLVTREKVNR